MKYQAWDYQAVRDRIIEAAETLIAHPAALGPRMASGSMSNELARASDAYGKDRPSYRRTLSAGALSRMEETWEWINTWLNEAQRKTVYDYGFIRSRKGLILAKWCERNEVVKRTFERAVRQCCQVIADKLNQINKIRLSTAMDPMSQNHVEADAETVASKKYAHFEMMPGAKPRHDPNCPELQALIKRLEKQNAAREKRRERQAA